MCIEVVLAVDADRLMGNGKICDITLPPLLGMHAPAAALALRPTMRVGMFIFTSTHYSGGRVHLYQYAVSLASLGVEVFYVSNIAPAWRADYPEHGIKFVTWGIAQPPEDLDVVMTDGKGVAGARAQEYAQRHPSARLFVMNFETPNWVAEFAPDIADKVANGHKGIMLAAHGLVANSAESARYLVKWLGVDRPVSVLRPAVNTHAVAKSEKIPRLPTLPRPYVVWSARGQKYKGQAAAVKAVWSFKHPLDIVVFGSPMEAPVRHTLHEMHAMLGATDTVKFAVMRDAQLTLAPSLFEGFGMVPGESLSVGTPVVAYDLPVLRQEYGDVPGLYLVEHGNAGAFVAKVHELLSAPKPALDPKPIRERFGMDAMRRSVEDIPLHAVTRPRITAQMIAYWGFLPESIEAVYPYVDEILVAFGRDLHAQAIDDGSIERLRAFPDPDGKIKIEARGAWADKRNMRQWCLDHATGNHTIVLDGDEVWAGFGAWAKALIPYGAPRWVTLWHDAEHHVVDQPERAGARWGKEIAPYGSICGHYRWSYLRRSYRWGAHCRLETAAGLATRVAGSDAAERVPECVIYHLGHVLPPAVMRAKHAFYRARDGDDKERQAREKAWHGWTGGLGNCGDGIVKPVTWELPDVVKRAVESAKRIEVRA
jgi:glycosyltransferase involved in cell wall biosynthesis